MNAPIEFWVNGIPKPAGSKRAFVIKRKGTSGASRQDFRAVVTDDCKTSRDWKSVVTLTARSTFAIEPLTGPLRLDLTFYMPRPKHHFGTGKRVNVMKPDAPDYHTCKPDRTKLTRGTEDALTGVAWVDDAQVVDGRILKLYAGSNGPGCMIRISEA